MSAIGLFVSLMDANRHMISTGGLSEQEGDKQAMDLRVKHSGFHERRRWLRIEWLRRWWGQDLDDELMGQVIAWVERKIRKVDEAVQ